MKKVLQLTLLTLSMIFLSACSKNMPEPNSIIKNPAILKPVPNKENVFYYLNKDFNAQNYSYVVVPKIVINIDENDKKDIDQKLLKKISNYFQKNLQSELTQVLSKNSARNGLVMEISIVSFDVSFNNLKPWEYLPYGLAIKAIARSTGLESRKLNTTLAFKLSDVKSEISQIMVVDYKVKDEMPSYDEFKFENVKPLLDYWINNSKKKLQALNEHKYKY